MTSLADQHCQAFGDGSQPMSKNQAEQQLGLLSDHWQLVDEGSICGQFKFSNYYETQAFINAVAFVAHQEDHHPDITFGYNSASIQFTTHDVGGLSSNDFISAAKIDRLLA